MQRLFYTLTLFSLFFAAGCGNAVVVKGTAKMADGTAVESGIVYFHGEKDEYSANIVNGTFSPGRMKDGDGIPSGFYEVSVRGVVREVPSTDPAMDGSPERIPLIHSKYGTPETSGFTLDTSKSKTLDLVLEPAE